MEEYSDLNILFNNTSIMVTDNPEGVIEEDVLNLTVTTNLLLESIRMLSALMEHMKSKKEAIIINTASVFGFVPIARTTV
ncbi:SDR family NAD(P)-dependent oxidoreductase [Priestia megaterium]|uniref:SDR family NAD(P)-dependent oxidoreductase n=1 Tax=Priestia megaterium TaxID=1404 RepID=UPI003D00317B